MNKFYYKTEEGVNTFLEINTDLKWEFEGSNNLDGTPLEWNFMHGYQMLIYYRVK